MKIKKKRYQPEWQPFFSKGLDSHTIPQRKIPKNVRDEKLFDIKIYRKQRVNHRIFGQPNIEIEKLIEEVLFTNIYRKIT